MAEELSVAALRAEIDQIDEVLVRLLDRRARCAYAIGRVKRTENRAVYEPAREATVLARVREIDAALGGALDGDAIARLFERIIDEARRIQRIEAARDTDAASGDASSGGAVAAKGQRD
ncbi:MAG: chorismate mutase [Acidobacteriota bacterium]